VPSFRGLKITVGAVGSGGSALLESIAAQRGEWSASRGAEILIHGPVDPRSLQGIDVLVFSGDRLGELVDLGVLAVLPEGLVSPAAKEPEGDADAEARPAESESESGTDDLQFTAIAKPFRDQVARYGSDRMAFPLGGTALVLAYDRAAFDRPENRAAAEADGLKLEPPRTWEQLDALARFFQGRDWNGDGAADHGIALALGTDAEFLGEAIFLARAASLGQYRDQYSFLFDYDTMAPRIDSPPFVAALRGLAALKDRGPAGMAGFDAEAARRAFREGKVALLVDRAELAARWSHGKAVIGVAPLPGSERVYDPARALWEDVKPVNDPSLLPSGGGWLVGVNRAARDRQRDAALDFARYLINPETAKRLYADRAFPMLAVRPALMGQGPPDPRAALGVDVRQWSGAVSQTVTARRVIPGLRIPQADGYLADLSRERIKALSEEPAESALKRAAQAWTHRTEDLGRARQTWHYRRSLNALATLPEPPERESERDREREHPR
jgi:multiple sugar transport system substrate-binding protein